MCEAASKNFAASLKKYLFALWSIKWANRCAIFIKCRALAINLNVILDDWSLGEDLPTVHPHNQINEYNQGLLQPEEDVSDSERLRDFIPSLNNEFDRGFGSGDERNLTASLAGVRHPYEGGVPEPRTNETDFHRNFRFLWQEVFPIEGSGFPGRGTFRVFRTPEQLSTTSEISSTANDLYPTRTSTASSETPPTTVVAMSVTTQQSNGKKFVNYILI